MTNIILDENGHKVWNYIR